MNDLKFFTMDHAQAIISVTEKGVVDNKLAIYEVKRTVIYLYFKILNDLAIYFEPEF